MRWSASTAGLRAKFRPSRGPASRRSIKDAQVTSAGATIGEANTRVKPGETYTVIVPEAAPSDVAGEDIALNVVFEDASVIVIDKPAGLVVHPAAGHASGTLVNALVAHCGDSLSGVGGVKRPGIVHRLDKDTSGPAGRRQNRRRPSEPQRSVPRARH